MMLTPQLQGLAALVRPDAQILILGSMPGQVSLLQQHYYGHPRNQFWPLMQALFAVDATAAYEVRCQQLQQAGVALWDVIGSCQRQGSLDSAIVRGSIEFNDVAGLCRQLPRLQQIWLNGGKAAQSLRQYQQQLQRQSNHGEAADWPTARLTIRELPSTSPAHASLSFAEKLARWRHPA